jgi:hypothetical protein
MANPVLFTDKLRKLLLPDGSEKGLQFKQFNRILTSPDSEDLLTWNTFCPLEDVEPKSKWLLPLFRKAFGDGLWNSIPESELDQAELKFWHGRRTKEYFPPKEHDSWLRDRLQKSGVQKYWDKAKIGKRLEGPTEVDLVIETPKTLTFIEAKYLADIDCKATNDPSRDQLTRSICVGCHQARQRKFFFILLTPEYYERSRLYWYKMKDYRENPDLIREKLPYLSIDFGELSRSIGWILWREVFEIWKDLAGEFKLQEEDRKRLPLVLQHFIEIGLT